MKNKVFALVDCNSFFASCERVFQPALRDKPVAVLSNNDGCIISRSEEAKDLGLPMGAPLFKWEEFIKKNRINIFSANFTLYGDMSHRVMSILAGFVPDLEIYSIDEAFLSLENLAIKDYEEYAIHIRETILKYTGIPVSIGIASTKTLAKLANRIGKKQRIKSGVMNLLNLSNQELDNYFEKIDVGDIWGIGWRLRVDMRANGFVTVKDLKYSDIPWIRKKFSVIVERTVRELNGIPCIELSTTSSSKKSIASTRSFGRAITTYEKLAEAVSYYSAKASEKLREENETALYVQVYIRTNKFKEARDYFNSATISLINPTDFTPDITRAALEALRQIYRENFKYKKAGVLLFGLQPKEHVQMDIFNQNKLLEDNKKSEFMTVVDKLNKKWGRNFVKLAAEGVNRKDWYMKQERKSPEYTTNWNELLTVQ